MRFVLPKGRLFNASIEILQRGGIPLTNPEKRKLAIRNGTYELLISKPFDVPVYVEHGVEIGIAGSDVIEEQQCDILIPLKLPFGKCKLSVAMPGHRKVAIEDMDGFRIGTKYPHITQRFFENRNVKVEIIKLHGNVELAPRIGIADAIVDVVETGATLRANNLVEVEKVMEISAVLIVNRIAQKIRFEEINNLITRIKEVIDNGFKT